MRFSSELDQLLHISHVVGTNPQLVQAGGGNTSVKTANRSAMLIKASGTPLGVMSAQKGWVAVDLAKVRAVLEHKTLRTLPNAEREREVLGLLNGAIIEPLNARPSVETPLHALLDTVVMHSHAVAINALTCHPQGEQLMTQLLAGRKLPPLWVPYTDPGSTLAFALADSIDTYRKQYGDAPDILVLQNHGLFVAAPTPTECVLKQTEVLGVIEKYWFDQMQPGISAPLQQRISEALSQSPLKELDVRFSARPELTAAARGSGYQVFEGSLTPDHIVYYGPRAVIVEKSASVQEIIAAISAFTHLFKQSPRLLLVKGEGMALVAAGEAKLDAAELLAVSAVQIGALAQGTINFLEPSGVDFILNWEAEHYRAKQNA